MKVLYRRHRALVLALIPIPYLLLQNLLFFLANLMQMNPDTDALMWQCTSATAYTLFVLAPPCFFCTGIACVFHSVKKLCSREQMRRHAVLLPVGLATAILSALYFWQYWYV